MKCHECGKRGIAKERMGKHRGGHLGAKARWANRSKAPTPSVKPDSNGSVEGFEEAVKHLEAERRKILTRLARIAAIIDATESLRKSEVEA